MIIRVSEHLRRRSDDRRRERASAHRFSDPSLAARRRVDLRSRRTATTSFVRGRARRRPSRSTCGRCLEAFPARVDAPTSTSRFVPSPADRASSVELGADDLDTRLLRRRRSSTSAALVETETTLALPMKPLCRRGLPRALPRLRRQPQRRRLRLRGARARSAPGRRSRTSPARLQRRHRTGGPSMPLPKRRHSKTRGRKRRTHYKLVAPDPRRLPAVPRDQAAASRLPALRLLQGPRESSPSKARSCRSEPPLR